MRGDVAALERVRDRLRDMPRDVNYDQQDASLDLSRERSIDTPATYSACIAGVALAELCFGGDYGAAFKCFDDIDCCYQRDAVVLDEAAAALELDDGTRDRLFMCVTADSDEAAQAVQRVIDAIQAGDDGVTAEQLWGDLTA